MSVNSIGTSNENVSQTTQLDTKKADSASKKTDASEIKRQIKSSKKKYSAQQLMQKYGITKQQAEKILKDIEKETSSLNKVNAKNKDNEVLPVKEDVPKGGASTVQYKV